MQQIINKPFAIERDTFSQARLSFLLLPLLLIAASVIAVTVASPRQPPIDDTYITMTYARAIAEGRGFVFGSSTAPTLGTTTPLNTLLLAALYRLFPLSDPATIAVNSSVFFWLATAWLWALRGHAVGLTRLECVAVAALLLVETSLWTPFRGMETRLLTFLLTACLFLYVEGRFFWTGVATGLLFLTRGDGILMAAVLGLHQLSVLRKGDLAAPIVRRWLSLVAGWMLVALPWIFYAYFTFGSPLPATLAAKTIQTEMGVAQPFIVYLGYLFVGEWSSLGFVGGSAGLSPWTLLLMVGVGYACYGRRKPLLLLAWCAAYIAGYALLNIPTYKWYALPTVYVVTVFAALALVSPATLVPRLFPQVKRLGTPVAVALLLGVCPIILLHTVATEPVPDERHAVYQHLAAWINRNTPSGSRIANVEVGVLAWYSQREIVDLMGLVNPELLPELQQGGPQASFWQADSDYLICSSHFPWACAGLTSSEAFNRSYAPVATFRGRELGATEFPQVTYTIYGRQSAPVAPRHPVNLPPVR